MAIPLSDATDKRLARLFFGDEREGERRLLEQDCAENIVGSNGASPKGLKRLRFAVIRISGGTLEGLADAIALAQTDWRDALVSAGFGDDPKLHETWWPD